MVLFGQEHVDRYLATDGEEGHDWQGADVLILTTRGRRSGQPRQLPLIYGRHGDDYVIVASKGGWPHDPVWYLNLLADPHVELQVKERRLRAVARAATAAEKAELWPIMAAQWPAYDQYQANTERDIPVVVLTPQPSAGDD